MIASQFTFFPGSSQEADSSRVCCRDCRDAQRDDARHVSKRHHACKEGEDAQGKENGIRHIALKLMSEDSKFGLANLNNVLADYRKQAKNLTYIDAELYTALSEQTAIGYG
jgi:hypothetical protein